MADNMDDTLGEAELVEGLERKKLSGKKVVIGAIGAVVVLLAVLGAMSFMGGSDEAHEEDPLDQMAEDAAAKREQAKLEEDVPAEKLKTLFYELPMQQYNLNTGGQGSSFLRVQIQLEVDRESYKADLDAKLPRILDEFNVYMRELRPEDLDGAAGIFRLKEELLMRINQSVAPTRVKDVLFQEFLVQGG
ncbi:flagellar basal body-associated FliL family protein [Kordiimonas gwangyangensis]|uniref:flagellar basal body-associated FliL family protein n=1 Tax=Kordiimonas gwangyangensis TaxID=288022 RepID=UPI00038253C7|nr:flagellar basal body-associated FliL family protein [Kordiimonas gwangyangensis]